MHERPPRAAAPHPASARRMLRSPWFLVPAAWTVLALLASTETVVFWRMAGRDWPAWRAVASQAPGWLVYALLTPAILALGRRLPLRGPRLAGRVAVHAGAALAAGALYAATATAASFAFSPVPRTVSAGQTFVAWLLSALPLAVLTYAGVLGIGYALAYLAESRRREVEAARLEAELSAARLGALRARLHPHFLFNSLNAAAVLARDGDAAATARMLTDLGELLREVLRHDGAHEVELAEELAFARRYLAVEEVRFPDRLRVRVAVDDDVLDARVPSLVLQPLVENALRHGIARRSAAGRLEIVARRAPAAAAGGPPALELAVRDDGAGLPPDWGGADDYGVGLSVTAARLAQLYGGDASLALEPGAGGGTTAVVRLPLRARGADDAAGVVGAAVAS